jgi:release factor glutamine methyltransferase
MPPETVGTLLAEGRGLLEGQGIDTAALDARLLLQMACGVTHEAIVAEPRSRIGTEQATAYRLMIARRAAREPLSRIFGTREFYGRPFLLAPSVLDPRPDTETLIDAVIERFADRGPFRFLDLGTGSGNIALTILGELPNATAVATDLSPSALSVARANAARHGVLGRVGFLNANWFDAVEGLFDLLVSNPPYIPLSDIDRLEPEVRDHDPRSALDGGPDGLEAYRRITVGAKSRLAPGGCVMVEIGAGQEGDVGAIFAAAGFRLDAARNDLAGLPRCLTASFDKNVPAGRERASWKARGDAS